MTPALSRSLQSCGLDFRPVLPGLEVYAAPATAERVAKALSLIRQRDEGEAS